MSDLKTSDLHVDAVAVLAKAAVGSQIDAVKVPRDGKDVPVMTIGNDRKTVDVVAAINAFERTQPAPYRRRGTYHAADVPSLLAWMRKNLDVTSPVFGAGAENLNGEWRHPNLKLVGIGNYSIDAKIDWHDLRGEYDFPIASAWSTWAEGHGESMSQATFAEFIESRLYDLSSPKREDMQSESLSRFLELIGGDKGDSKVATPNKMLELSRGISIHVGQKMEQKIDTQTGEATLVYTEEHTGAGARPIKVPRLFYIRIPVFFGQPPVLIGVMLRYRAAQGSVSWSYELFAPDLVVKEQFDAACKEVSSANWSVYLGSPDSILPSDDK